MHNVQSAKNISKNSAYQIIFKGDNLTHIEHNVKARYNPIVCSQGYIKPTRHLKKVQWGTGRTSCNPLVESMPDLVEKETPVSKGH